VIVQHRCAHQPSEVVRLCRSTYASRYRAVELNTLSRRNRTPHALLARGAEGLKRSSAAYLCMVRARARALALALARARARALALALALARARARARRYLGLGLENS